MPRYFGDTFLLHKLYATENHDVVSLELKAPSAVDHSAAALQAKNMDAVATLHGVGNGGVVGGVDNANVGSISHNSCKDKP